MGSGQTKEYKIVICTSPPNAQFKANWLTQKHNNVFEWSDISSTNVHCTSGHHDLTSLTHQNCYRHDILYNVAEQLLTSH